MLHIHSSVLSCVECTFVFATPDRMDTPFLSHNSVLSCMVTSSNNLIDFVIQCMHFVIQCMHFCEKYWTSSSLTHFWQKRLRLSGCA